MQGIYQITINYIHQKTENEASDCHWLCQCVTVPVKMGVV